MKEGAEALDCAVALGPGLGIAVKVADGGYRAAGPATISVLDQLGLVPAAARRRRSPPCRHPPSAAAVDASGWSSRSYACGPLGSVRVEPAYHR